MKVHLEETYERLCIDYHAKPLAGFLTCLRNTYAAPNGEVFIDASAVEGEHFCVFGELLRHLLKEPNAFIKPTIVRDMASLALLHTTAPSPSAEAAPSDRDVFFAVPPRLLRLKLRLSRNVNNTDVERICGMIDVEKELRCVPVAIPAGGSLLEHVETSGSVSQLAWPEKAVVECVDLSDAVFVSLAGGRALRAAARRNAYLLSVFLNGCSVNRAVVEQVAAATRQNRLRFHAVCGML